MRTRNSYPVAMCSDIRRLRYDEGHPAPAVFAIIRSKYPDVPLTIKALYKIASRMRKKETVRMRKTAIESTTTENATSPNRQLVLEEATNILEEATNMKLQTPGMRWGAIHDLLKAKYPSTHIPGAQVLGRLCKSKPSSRGSCQVTITHPKNGTASFVVPMHKAEQFIKSFLEG